MGSFLKVALLARTQHQRALQLVLSSRRIIGAELDQSPLGAMECG